MRTSGCLATGLALGVLAAGCWYERPSIEEMFADVEIGMSRDDVIERLGEPTHILGDTLFGDPDDPTSVQSVDELFYLYDDPLDPVRLRFVLNDKGFVIRKFYETKKELAQRAEEVKGELPPVELMPSEEPRTYPGGPLRRFEAPPGKPVTSP